MTFHEESMQSDLLSKKEALAVYRKMYLARAAEERIRKEYSKDEMKTPVHLAIGGEAISVGVCHCLPVGAKTFGTYRNHALYLTMSDDVDGFFAELYGKVTGCGKGKAGSMHLSAPDQGLVATSAVVATTIPLAVGAALAMSYKGQNGYVAVFFGDGAVEEGVFWESLNFACLHRLRLIFVCEDNELAIHTHLRDRRGFKSILEIVKGYECHVGSGDGCNVQSVIVATHDLMRKMDADPSPSFLYLPYYRFLEHVGPREDFDAGYRPRPSTEDMKRYDPLHCFETDLCQDGCQQEELMAIRSEIEKRIDAGVLHAQQSPFPEPSELYADVLL